MPFVPLVTNSMSVNMFMQGSDPDVSSGRPSLLPRRGTDKQLFCRTQHLLPCFLCQVLFSLGDRFTKTEVNVDSEFDLISNRKVCTSMGHFITKRVLSKFYRYAYDSVI